MSLKKKIAEKTGMKNLPSHYQIIGHVFLAKLSRLDKMQKKVFAKAVMEILPYIKTVCEIKCIKGTFRKPKTSRILGGSMETVHKENGILYKLDVSKIMFSKGNMLERQRLVNQIRNGETIIDMFAGIGYFSLGIGKLSKAEKIYSIEKNPLSFKYLRENIKLNNIKNISPILGDCRKIKKIKADRILMGYFPGTEKFLKTAFSFLNNKGIIHYHNIYARNDLMKPIEDVDKAAKKAGYIIKSFKQRTVKSYNAAKDHIVLDVEISKINQI